MVGLNGIKSEIRISKSETNPKFQEQMFQTFRSFCIRISYLFRISIFGFRIFIVGPHDPPCFLHVQGHLVDKPAGGVESFNVSQARQKVNLNRPAVEVAVVVQAGRPRPSSPIRRRSDCRPDSSRSRTACRRSRPGRHRSLRRAEACRFHRHWRSGTQACFRGPGREPPSHESGRAG